MRTPLLVAALSIAACRNAAPDRSAEGRQTVKKLYESARTYYIQMSATSEAPRFPGPSVGPTPPLGTCCQEGGKCAPRPELWTAGTWTALQFSVDDPHYYSYEFQVGADGQSFTARAYGDLDCDGEYQTFEMFGVVEPAPH